jgi:osmoprotectant transport system permease protein
MRRRIVLSALLVLALPAASTLAAEADPAPVVIGSKNFEENRLLAEVFAQLLEARTDLTVDRRFDLAGTQICFEALKAGSLDLYPEYTGTGWTTILGREPVGDRAETLARVREEFLHRFDLWWLAPLGFENSYEIAVPEKLAEEHGLRTISDLVPLAPELRGGFGYEFTERPDGLPGLRKTYGLHFGDTVSMQQALKYQAVRAGETDVLDVYTTEGRLLSYDLRVLEDDKGFFPPYEAAALVRGDTLARHPEIGTVLGLLAGALDEDRMRHLNFRLEEGKEPPERVAADLLAELGLVEGGETVRGDAGGDRGSFFAYLWSRRRALGGYTVEHLGLSAAALALGVLVAVPLGLALERRRRIAESVIRAVGVTQTVPSLALLAFMIPLLGIGVRPAIVALWIYSLFPILRNTYTGVRDAGPEVVQAARALGMTPGQVLRWVRLPLALPVILAGVRTAAVLLVGTATLAAFIGAGGLGEPIVTGLQLADTWQILSGAIPAALLAILVDGALALVERALRPRGVDG